MPSGQPTKLTPDLQEKFCGYVRDGQRIMTTCKLCRINYTSYSTWMTRGTEEEEGIHKDFYDAVLQADAENEAQAVAKWQKLNTKSKDYKSHKAFLESRHGWERPTTKTETKTEITQTTAEVVDYSNLSIDDLLQLKQLHAKAKGTIIEAEFEEVKLLSPGRA